MGRFVTCFFSVPVFVRRLLICDVLVWIKAHAEKKKIRKVVVGKIVLIAIERLVGNKDWNALKLSDLKLNDILAVLASRLQLAVNPYSKICIEMIAKNLATCVRVVEGSDSVEIMYPSEPILAEASARLLNKFDDWSFFIKVFFSDILK